MSFQFSSLSEFLIIIVIGGFHCDDSPGMNYSNSFNTDKCLIWTPAPLACLCINWDQCLATRFGPYVVWPGGWFLNVFDFKLSYKSNPMFGGLWFYIEEWHFLSISDVSTYKTKFVRNCPFLFHHLVTLPLCITVQISKR